MNKAEWFLSLIGTRIMPEPNTGCWLWAGAVYGGRGRTGRLIQYGHAYHKGRAVAAHRLSWSLLRGAIPDGMTIDHLCRQPLCVNPDHLRAVGLRENILAGRGVGAIHAAQTHCAHGHPFDDENTSIRPGGWRRCRVCHREQAKRARLRPKSSKPEEREEAIVSQTEKQVGRERAKRIERMERRVIVAARQYTAKAYSEGWEVKLGGAPWQIIRAVDLLNDAEFGPERELEAASEAAQ